MARTAATLTATTAACLNIRFSRSPAVSANYITFGDKTHSTT